MKARWLAPLVMGVVLLAGCGKSHSPTAPQRVVDLVPSRARYEAGEDIHATLRNLSRVTVYVDWACPAPALERDIDDQWVRQNLAYVVVCPLTVAGAIPPLSYPIAAGASLQINLLRSMLATEIGPGVYRFVMSASLDPVRYEPLASETFEVAAR